MTRSPSVAVVSEMAPRWMTASSRRPFSQSASSAGGTMSASWRLARLRHLPSWPSTSQTVTSVRPASFNAATTFDPIKPAPPVTSNMPIPALLLRRQLCPSPGWQATWLVPLGEEWNPLQAPLYLLTGSRYRQGRNGIPSNYEYGFINRPGGHKPDPHRSLHVD